MEEIKPLLLDLPEEMLVAILHFMTEKERLEVSTVCSVFNRLIKDPQHWEKLPGQRTFSQHATLVRNFTGQTTPALINLGEIPRGFRLLRLEETPKGAFVLAKGDAAIWLKPLGGQPARQIPIAPPPEGEEDRLLLVDVEGEETTLPLVRQNNGIKLFSLEGEEKFFYQLEGQGVTSAVRLSDGSVLLHGTKGLIEIGHPTLEGWSCDLSLILDPTGEEALCVGPMFYSKKTAFLTIGKSPDGSCVTCYREEDGKIDGAQMVIDLESRSGQDGFLFGFEWNGAPHVLFGSEPFYVYSLSTDPPQGWIIPLTDLKRDRKIGKIKSAYVVPLVDAMTLNLSDGVGVIRLRLSADGTVTHLATELVSDPRLPCTHVGGVVRKGVVGDVKLIGGKQLRLSSLLEEAPVEVAVGYQCTWIELVGIIAVTAATYLYFKCREENLHWKEWTSASVLMGVTWGITYSAVQSWREADADVQLACVGRAFVAGLAASLVALYAAIILPFYRIPLRKVLGYGVAAIGCGIGTRAIITAIPSPTTTVSREMRPI